MRAPASPPAKTAADAGMAEVSGASISRAEPRSDSGPGPLSVDEIRFPLDVKQSSNSLLDGQLAIYNISEEGFYQ